MKRNKFVVLGIMVVTVVFMLVQSGYALEIMKRPVTGDNENAQNTAGDTMKEENNKDLPKKDKKSVYNGISTLIAKGKFTAGTEFELSEYKEDRLAYVNDLSDVNEYDIAPGGESYSISDPMIHAELNSMMIMGLIQRTEKGKYRVLVSMTADQRDEIDRLFQSEIVRLHRKEPGLDRSIGLNAWTLQNLSDQDKTKARRIVGNVLLSGKTIQTTSKDHPLQGLGYESVIVFTDKQIQDKGLKNTIAENILNLGANKKLIIATPTKVEYDDKGNLTKKSQGYVDGILRGLPMELARAKSLFEDKVIIFTQIEDQRLLAEIESIPFDGVHSLNQLAPVVALKLV